MDKSDKSAKDVRDENEELPRWTEMIKKVMSVGLGAAFMTEESIRTYLSEVPKEVVSNIIQNANKSKEELLNRVGTEVIRLIQKIDFVKEASRFAEEHKFKISAEVEVVKKDKHH
jgi:hypothetical protein